MKGNRNVRGRNSAKQTTKVTGADCVSKF